MDGTDALSISVIGDLANIERAAWDGLANPPDQPYDPFLSWDFLRALEESGCASPQKGWQPAHLIACDPGGAPVGAQLNRGAHEPAPQRRRQPSIVIPQISQSTISPSGRRMWPIIVPSWLQPCQLTAFLAGALKAGIRP